MGLAGLRASPRLLLTARPVALARRSGRPPRRAILSQADVVCQKFLTITARTDAGPYVSVWRQLPCRFSTSEYLPLELAPVTAIVSCSGSEFGFSAARPVNCTPLSGA